MPEQMQNLWAPWRMQYIEGLKGPAPTDADACFLCAAQRNPAADEANFVLWRSRRALTILNRYPYSSGHTLIAPFAHVAAPEALDEDDMLELMRELVHAKAALDRALHPQGYNIGVNLGHCAGAGLPGHLHLHIVPRWSGDTNFMPVVGDVKVIPLALADVRRRLIAADAEIRSGAGA